MDDATAMHDRTEPMPDDVTDSLRQPGGPDSSLERMLGLLDLFSEERPTWTVEEIQEHLSLSLATAYRYLKLLSRTGLLAPAAGGAYSLGPRIVQLDRQMRHTDPLLRHGIPVIERARPELHGMFLLSRHYGDHVLCVHQDRTDPKLRTSMERGLPMEMFRGAAPRIILAFLPTYQLRNLMLRHADRIRAAGLGPGWDEFRIRLKAMRKEGSCIAVAEVDPGMVGVAAPIFRAQGAVIGAISLALSEERFAIEDPVRLRELARRIAGAISAGIMRSESAPR